ncbi:MAG TPA: DUF4249 domain-containing protein [Puia sp.]|nr:DUF4249 domain-containing protein [Puia sp.]
MTRTFKNIASLLVLTLALIRCKDPYVSPYVSPPTGYLVVDGFISGNGPTRFNLGRTIPVSGNVQPPAETKAHLQVEGDDNSIFTLNELGNGVYGIDTLPLNPAAKYRLRIHTAGNKDYLSDYVPFRNTPVIDSISWSIDNSGVNIYANTHDASNNTRYYQWQYVETWKYSAAEYSSGIYQKESPFVVDRHPEDQIYYCWKNNTSTSILLGSSIKLSQDVISRQLLTHISKDDPQLSIKYSILVKQNALTEDAYNYLTLMQKNTETLGSIFDAQPSYLKGNIHGLTDPTEQVIGFVAAGTVQQQRIFIDRSQLPQEWRYFMTCILPDTLVKLDSASLTSFFGPGGGFVPVEMHYTNGLPDGWLGNTASCVDCRTQGGNTNKPSFWPN